MKRTITLLLIVFTLTGYSQSINLQLDTTQTLQNSDGGSVAYADIDLDGDNDLLITGNTPNTNVSTTLYENDGTGNFTAMSQPDIINVYAGAAKFADVDNDGDMDLMMTGNTNSPAATANLYINDGSGGFTISIGTPFEPSNSGDIDFGDIDGDNDLDLIMTGLDAFGNPFAKLYFNDGTGSYSLVSGTSFTAVLKSSVEFIDVDNDIDLDLLICGADSSDASVTTLYLNNGSGIFSAAAGVPFEDVKLGDIAFGDTDNDGDIDILLTGENLPGQGVAKFYINNNGSFSLLPNTPFPGVFLHSSSFADFNNDGKPDLLHIGNSATGLIAYVYENLGSNNFILADSTLSGSYNGSNITADLNGDNKIDIVTTGTSFTAPIRAPKIYMNQSVVVSVIENENAIMDFQVHPNPTNNFIKIIMNSDSPTDFEIFNLSGHLVLRGSFVKSISNIFINESPGVYLVRLKNDNQIFTRKIVVK